MRRPSIANLCKLLPQDMQRIERFRAAYPAKLMKPKFRFARNLSPNVTLKSSFDDVQRNLPIAVKDDYKGLGEAAELLIAQYNPLNIARKNQRLI